MTTQTNRSNINIANLFSAENVDGLETSHAGRIQANFRNNLSNIGRYGHKDFERFGNLTPQDPKNLGRQDGWVSLTEEVPHINHLTYGTGTLYVHGEMEIPPYEDNAGAQIIGSNFNATLADGTQTFQDGYILPYSIKPSDMPDGNPVGWEPEDDANTGYAWEWYNSNDPPNEEGPGYKGLWWWSHFVKEAGGIPTSPDRKSNITPTGDNDAEVYVLNNERNNFPWVIINSASPASVKTLLNTLKGSNGMFDGILPQFARNPQYMSPIFPPVVNNGISYEDGGISAIADFISPLDT